MGDGSDCQRGNDNLFPVPWDPGWFAGSMPVLAVMSAVRQSFSLFSLISFGPLFLTLGTTTDAPGARAGYVLLHPHPPGDFVAEPLPRET